MICAFQILVQLFQGEHEVFSRQTDIRASNVSSETPPPISLDDFPDDYTCSIGKCISSGKIRSWWSSRPRASQPRLRLAVTIPEPEVMILSRAQQQGNVSCVNLDATFHLDRSSESADEASRVPDDMNITISWLLKTTAFLAVVPMHELPTFQDTAADPYIAALSTSTPLRSVKLVLRDWTSCADGCAPLSSVNPHSVQRSTVNATTAPVGFEARWHKHERLFLPLADLSECSTTFSTPYISRRHTIEVQIESRSSGSSTVQLKLRVPIQIVKTALSLATYGGGVAPSGELTEDQSDCATLTRQTSSADSPVYVR